MMKALITSLFVLLLATVSAAQQPGLEAVLDRMDSAAAGFKSAETDFVWDQYEKVVNETTKQSGKMFFRRSGKDIQMAADINGDTPGDKKYVLYQGDRMRLYQPNIDQVTEYAAGKDKGAIESFLVLGFGGRGHDMLKSFDVKLLGNEAAGGVNAAKLQLTPKTEKARGVFDRILLWIDPARGVSVQQQFFEPSGNFRLAKYSNIKLNEKIPDDAFQLKTTGHTKVVNPRG
ncbi:MAG TPA: outer membrane lipoprotein-sorting protein [Terriglobales bacterium]|nr:outer membrane lipoprotein-sorting protein [Terriglobales bacterium]